MKTETEIREKRSELVQQIVYLQSFLHTCYKGSDAKQKVEKELISQNRELEMINWVIDDNLPF